MDTPQQAQQDFSAFSDLDGANKHLVFEHRANGRNMVPGGICELDGETLTIIMSSHPEVRLVTKPITPGRTSVDLYKWDLLTETEREAAAVKIAEAAEKGEKQKEECPYKVFLGHQFEGHAYEELTILVPEIVALGGREKTPEEQAAELEQAAEQDAAQ